MSCIDKGIKIFKIDKGMILNVTTVSLHSTKFVNKRMIKKECL